MRERHRRSAPLVPVLAWLAGLGLAVDVQAQATRRVSLGPGGSQADFGADVPFPGAFVSGDGRFVAFMSPSTNLVSGDTNQAWDIFVRDRLSESTQRVSVGSSGNQSNGPSGLYGLCISTDGRFVVFESAGSNLVTGDTNATSDIFLRDCLLGTTERVSIDSAGVQANSSGHYPAISADGRYVVFESGATNLVSGDTNGFWDVFIRDRLNGTTDMISVGMSGSQSNGNSGGVPAISPDGRYVVFASDASNLVPGDANNSTDVFVYDRGTGLMDLASVSSGGAQGNGMSLQAAISADGQLVAFTSAATNLVTGDSNAALDVFVRDRVQGSTERISVSSAGVQGNGDSTLGELSADGRFVSFISAASTLVSGDFGWNDVFIRDRLLHTTERLSVTSTGGQASGSSQMSSISTDGRYVVFRSSAPDIVAGDTNTSTDIFIRDRLAAGFTSLCDPGTNNVIACPCANQPSSANRGCDNSSGTGGASLEASGVAYLTTDSLAFTTNGERPSATSVLLQGDAFVATGLVFGQGVRCSGGTLRRMYVKTATNGSITAPDSSAGDPAVSVRSAQLGTPIQPGQPYYYLVYYRDPVVLGGCSAMNTFNATQVGAVIYWP